MKLIIGQLYEFKSIPGNEPPTPGRIGEFRGKASDGKALFIWKKFYDAGEWHDFTFFGAITKRDRVQTLSHFTARSLKSQLIGWVKDDKLTSPAERDQELLPFEPQTLPVLRGNPGIGKSFIREPNTNLAAQNELAGMLTMVMKRALANGVTKESIFEELMNIKG